jgi:outer membrane protein assembly factor BamA
MSLFRSSFSSGQIIITFFLLFTFRQFLRMDSRAEGLGINQKSDKLNVFPVIMYDSDIGLGLGGRTLLKDYWKKKESFDLLIFASSKGEQLYMFQFSLPDAELRQRKSYALGYDFRIEWDKLLKSNYFGTDNDSPNNDFQFPREYLKIDQIFSHTFSPFIIGEAGLLLVHHTAYNYDETWNTIQSETPGVEENLTAVLSGSMRLDTRDSQIHPTSGERVYLKAGFSRPTWGSDWNYSLYRLESSLYRRLFNSPHIMAVRLWLQQINGTAPYQELSKIGDGWTARGYKADRFLDQSMILSSLEYRFPLYRALGGVVFLDAGRVAPQLKELNFSGLHSNLGWGVRYYLPHFVARFDMGFSTEGTRVFFNFGQVF